MSDSGHSEASSSLITRRRGERQRRHARSVSMESDHAILAPSLADELDSGAAGNVGMSQSSTFAEGLVDMGAMGFSLQDELSGLNDDGQGGAVMAGSTLGDELDAELGCDKSDTVTWSAPVMSSARLDEEQYHDTATVQRQAAYESVNMSLIDAIHSTDAHIAALKTTTDGDDTRRMEETTRQIVLALQKSAREREVQTKELQDLIRTLDRDEGGALQSALVEALSEQDEDGVPAVSCLSSPWAESANAKQHTSTSTESPSKVSLLSQSPPPVISRSDLPPPGPSRRAPLVQHLSHLQVVTSSLVSSLQSINEQTQINNAAFRESTKSLRRVTLQLTETLQEHKTAEASRAWIECRMKRVDEPQVAPPTLGSFPSLLPYAAPGSVGEWSRHQMAEYEQYLDDAAMRARLLLQSDG